MEDFSYNLLEALARASGEYVEASELSESADVTGRVLHDALEKLKRLGLPVESHPVYGLRLPVDFDLVDRASVRNRLSRGGRQWPVHGALEVASTNDLATAAAIEGQPAGTTFFAEHQSRGRGRLGRSWHSPVGTGLWFSILRRQDLSVEDGWRVTLGAGLAVAEAIGALSGLIPTLKWPNDVHLDGRKVAGILTESRSDRGRLKYSIIGIGINVHQAREDFPPELREIAVSVRSVGGHVRREDLLVEVLERIDDIAGWGADRLRLAWSERCSHWGDRVRVEQDDRHVEGTARSLSPEGAFLVELDDGSLFPVHSGDVTQLRSVS